MTTTYTGSSWDVPTTHCVCWLDLQQGRWTLSLRCGHAIFSHHVTRHKPYMKSPVFGTLRRNDQSLPCQNAVPLSFKMFQNLNYLPKTENPHITYKVKSCLISTRSTPKYKQWKKKDLIWTDNTRSYYWCYSYLVCREKEPITWNDITPHTILSSNIVIVKL